MFGHDEDATTKSNSQNLTTNEPVDDGTLGLPATDNDTSSYPTEPSTNATDDIVPVPPPAQPPTSDEALLEPNSSPDKTDDLLSIKQKALQQLKPLIGHLEQTPEERFRTTMMMIQAADDQSLIPQAYQSANDISDEKTRAQALLDVINEINYFHSQKIS